jgi:hypothetical protein
MAHWLSLSRASVGRPRARDGWMDDAIRHFRLVKVTTTTNNNKHTPFTASSAFFFFFFYYFFTCDLEDRANLEKVKARCQSGRRQSKCVLRIWAVAPRTGSLAPLGRDREA